jgi:hypothetical protein
MSFARYNLQDAFIELDIGFDSELLQALYPSAWERFVSTHNIKTDQPTLQTNNCMSMIYTRL